MAKTEIDLWVEKWIGISRVRPMTKLEAYHALDEIENMLGSSLP